MKSCALMSVFVFCVFLALIGVALATHEASPVTQQQRAAALAYQQARDAQDLAERSRQAQQWADLTAAWLPVAKVAGGLLIAVTPLALLALAAVGWGLTRRRAALVYPDSRGLLPADYDRLRRGEYDGHALTALAGHHAAQLEAARNPSPMLPPTLRTYAPRYNSPAPRVIGQPEQRPALAAPASPVAIPTFGDLLRLGQVGQGRALVLGYTSEGAPVKGDMDSLFSFGVAGLQGSGKTTTERFLLGQVALQGGRFALIDPHRDTGAQSLAGTLDPLRASFLLPPAAADSEIYQVIELVNEEIDRRERGEQGPVIVLAVDEWTDLSRRRCADDLKTLARRVSTVGRKLGIYTALSGQGWTKEAAGEVRDYLTAAYVHKLRPQVARLLAPGVGNEVWSLEPGQAILDRTTGPRLTVTIPNTRAEDLTAVAGLLPAPADFPDNRKVERRPSLVELINPPQARPSLTVLPRGGSSSSSSSSLDNENDPENDENEAEVTTTTATTPKLATPLTLVEKARAMGIDLDAEDWRVLDLLDQGKSYHKIGEMIAGRSGGTAYSKWRGQAERLHDLITNWPDGERWSTAAEGD